jgi:hypothetical protein
MIIFVQNKTQIVMSDGYNIYLMIEQGKLLINLPTDFPYDKTWEIAGDLYADFANSKYNDPNKPIIECINEYYRVYVSNIEELDGVGCGIHPITLLVYPQLSNGSYALYDPTHLDDHSDEWFEKVCGDQTKNDLIKTLHTLYSI